MVYTPVTVSGYNTNPPPDDGSAVAGNEIEWTKHKTKLGDPLKTALEGINTNVTSAFGKIVFNGHGTVSTNTTLGASDHGDVKLVTNSPTISLTAAATLGAGWNCVVYNVGSGTVTIDPNGSETINNTTTIEISGANDWAFIYCDGTEFHALTKPADAANFEFPVGSVYMNYSDATNPATLLGYGTWVAMQDRMLIGAGGTYSAGATGGSATTTQSESQIAPHNHTVNKSGDIDPDNYARGGRASSDSGDITTSSAGSGAAMTTISPYIAVYIWRRTA